MTPLVLFMNNVTLIHVAPGTTIMLLPFLLLLEASGKPDRQRRGGGLDALPSIMVFLAESESEARIIRACRGCLRRWSAPPDRLRHVHMFNELDFYSTLYIQRN